MDSIFRCKKGQTRVMIVDDHTLVRIGLTDFLNCDNRFEVVGEADSCASGMEMARRLLPDIVILDTELGDATGCSALRKMHMQFPDISMVIYSSNQCHRFVDDAFKHNISAYVLKSSPLESLMHALQCVREGMEFIDPNLPHYIPNVSVNLPPVIERKIKLTDRERTTLQKLVLGKSNKEIANELFITERTVKFHVSSILRRLGVKNRTQAVRVATEMRLLDESNGFPAQDHRRWNGTRYLDRRNKHNQNVKVACHTNFERRSGQDRRKMDRQPAVYLPLASNNDF